MARRTASSKERGFTLAGLLAILTVIVIFVTMTVPPQWSKVMARERDMQTIFIMKQYARSIRNFQLKHGSAPVSLQQLKDAKAPRMMRGKGEWLDPLTGKVDWIPIPAGAQQGTSVLPPGVAPPVQSVRPTPPPTPPGQQGAHSPIVRVECHGSAQQALPFLRIAAQEARQLRQHLSLRSQGRGVVGREGERVVDLAPDTREIAQYPKEAEGASA